MTHIKPMELKDLTWNQLCNVHARLFRDCAWDWRTLKQSNPGKHVLLKSVMHELSTRN